MTTLSTVPLSASRRIAAIWFWIAGLACGVAFVAATNDWAPNEHLHGFEQGILGLELGIGIAAAMCTVSVPGFLLAQLLLPRISVATSRRYYLLSGMAGFTALLGSQVVAGLGRNIVSTSELFWCVFIVGGQMAVAFLISVIILWGGYWSGLIRHP